MGWKQLGKKRSRFGSWSDEKGIKQLDVEKASDLSRGTVSKIFNDDSYDPPVATRAKLEKGLKKLGYKRK
jgi:transcriptional regulator with XRE-family HTH domain